MNRETIVPSIPDIRDDNVKEVLRAIKNVLDVREGNIGDPLDQVVTMRELSALNLADKTTSTSTAYGANLPVGTVLTPVETDGYNPSTDYTTPPPPTNLRARGGFTNVYLEWDGAPMRNIAFTEIWRARADNLGSAVLVGTTVANVYADPAESDTQYFYWVRFVSQANITGPYNSTSGTSAATAFDVAKYLPALQDEISSSQLFIDLGTRVAATETGITSLQKITATSAEQVTMLSSVVGNNSSAIQIQAKVSDGLSAQYTVKIDVNGHVSGFGLASSSVNGTPTSAFIVRADRFAIAGANSTTDPLGTLNPTKVPFMVLTTPTVINGKTYPAGTWMDTAFIANATIGTAQIADLTADKITTGTLTAAIGISTGRISGGVNTSQAFASASYGTGFFLGQDAGVYKFYAGSPTQNMRWDGTNLTVTGNIYATGGSFGAALISGQLTAGQIDTRGLTIQDASGNVILSSGTPTSSANMVPNADLRDGTDGEQPTVAAPLYNVGVGFLQNGGTASIGLNRSSSWKIAGVGLGYMRITSGTPGIADVAIFASTASLGYTTTSKYFQISPSKRYEASIYVAASAALNMDIGIEFVDGSGNPLSYEPHGTALQNANVSGVSSMDQLVRLSVFTTAGSIPSNARGAYIILRTYGTTNGTYIYFTKPYFGEAGASQTVPSAWSQGRGIGQITPGNASTYIADASITSAAIGTAAVGTLKIGGNAVTVPTYAANTLFSTTVTTTWMTVATAYVTIAGLGSGETAGTIISGYTTFYENGGAATTLVTGIFVDGVEYSISGCTLGESKTNSLTTYANAGNGTYTVEIKVRTDTTAGGASTKAGVVIIGGLIVMSGKR